MNYEKNFNNLDNKNDKYNYIEYLTLKKMNEKIMISGKTGIDLENEIYLKNNVILTEKEKIYFEVGRIYKKLKQKEYVNNILKENQNFYFLLTEFIKQLSKIENENYNNYDSLKKIIIKLQIYLNIKSGFYSIVPSMLEDLDINKGRELTKNG